MENRLAPMIFVPPETGRKWHGQTLAESPQMFYSSPPWHTLVPTAAEALAGAIADEGVCVSAMLTDLSSKDEPSTFHSENRSRIVPYRSERYGISPEDFDDTSVIDIRLAVPRDHDGRFAYSPGQIARWESTPPDAPLGGGSWIPAASFPPDVSSLKQLSIKIEQLRVLSPAAKVVVSMYPHRLKTELPVILSQKPDGVLLRCPDEDLPSLSIAKFIQQARKIIDEAEGKPTQLWVDAAGMSPTDAAKLTHLGATGVSIDSWCHDLFQYVSETLELGIDHSPKSSQIRKVAESRIPSIVKHMLVPYLDEFRGYAESMTGLPERERMATTDAHWASELGLPHF